jgi:preprotein translocase subunit SecG
MEHVILVIHLILALAIIALVLIQRSEGGGLGIGGGGGGMGGLATAGQTANALTRATAICAGLFFTTSLILAILAGTHSRSGSMLDSLDQPAPAAQGATSDPLPDNVDPAAPATDIPAPRAKDGDKDAGKLDSSDSSSDKEVPKAGDDQQQTGAPSAPISQ